MAISAEQLATATRLTRAGRLMEATRAIQAALGFGRATKPPAPPAAESAAHARRNIDAVDVAFRETVVPPLSHPAPREAESSFTSGVFAFSANHYRYRLFVPSRAANTPLLPVVVMLHGCKQNAEDFARGTAMNALAEREQVIVLYPEQLRKGNGMGCWNWFEPRHQGRDAGEPAMIAALVQQVAGRQGGDPSRIFVAGLSAGAAMAVLLGELFPDVFAAVGAHSGLPAGAAGDVASAFAAMKRGAEAARDYRAVPTIIFHGSGDQTVAPGNSDAIAQGQLAAWSASGVPLTKSAECEVAGSRTAKRTTWTDPHYQPRLEVWHIEGGPHAWSGGDAAGSYTDPQGPSASEAMLEFFLLQRRSQDLSQLARR